MNDSDLEKFLKAGPAPDRTPEFWDDFPRRITTKLHWQARRTGDPVPEKSRPVNRLAWGLSIGMACLVIAFALSHWRGNRPTDGLLQNEKVIWEVLAMFPNQVRAIVQDENGLSLSLADEPNVPASTPLWIKICDGKQCRSVVTFSGQVMQIAGQRVEVLADARGGVMLLGDHFFWSSRESVLKDHLRIDAQPLSHVL